MNMLTKTKEAQVASAAGERKPMTMIQALRSAHDVMMERDDNVVVFGEDVGYFGGVFRVTEGLQAAHHSAAHQAAVAGDVDPAVHVHARHSCGEFAR